jgi:hypothetical protein
VALADEIRAVLSDTTKLPPEFLNYIVQHSAQNPVPPSSLIAPTITSSGQVGSTQKCRLVGSTSFGAPTVGTYQIGDFVIDQQGTVWICIASGSPGTWVQGTISFGGKIGYGGGAGGTVVQATSKSTAVTLNTPSGAILTSNAALAAGASVVFTLNNTSYNAPDLVLLTLGNSTSTDYRVEVASAKRIIGVSYQIFIRITNVSAGSLSEALTINFAIIAGSQT